MSITLTFTDFTLGGDIDLQDSAIGVLQYDPQPPTSEDIDRITETITVYLNSGAKAARTGNGFIHRLERYFERARRRQKLGTGLRIYLQYKPYAADATYRTEILDGRVVWRSGTASAAWLPSDTGECAIIFTRRAYWEADTEAEIPLSVGGAAATGGVNIVNHNDSEANDNNWVLIDSTDVVGSLPAPSVWSLPPQTPPRMNSCGLPTRLKRMTEAAPTRYGQSKARQTRTQPPAPSRLIVAVAGTTILSNSGRARLKTTSSTIR